MGEFGHFALVCAWFLALFGFVAGAYAGLKAHDRLFLSVRNGTILCALCLMLSTGALGYQFLTDDYTNQFVWQFSNSSMQAIYKISAIWGGMDGSMLLWALILSCSGAIVAYSSVSMPRRLMPWVLSILNSSTLFFTSVVLYLTNPFRYISAPYIPPDGNGLNPLLQNPYMAVHPPMLYLGFTTFAVPFSFCMGALLSNNLGNEWLRLTRRWSLLAWAFLTFGIALGGHWAYLELGWGGFWAWDPVENSSFLPWITGSAYLHSVMVQERKNMLKFWNVWLIVVTYGLTVFGTFLTRSGIVQSVHAFASTDIGWVFLLYLSVIFLATAALSFMRRDELRSEKTIESLLSREAAFLVNNLLFLSICFAVLWGVMFPVLSEAITGKKQTIGIPFFNAVNVPLFLALIALMGIGPMIAWRKASVQSLKKAFLAPFVGSFAIGVFLLWVGIHDFYPILSYSLCFFVAWTILAEIHRGMRVHKPEESPISSLSSLLRRHRIRYGGYLIHFGVVIVTIGITASMAHKTEVEFTLGKGETVTQGRFNLTLNSLEGFESKNYEALRARVSVTSVKNNDPLGSLEPEMRLYNKNGETTSEVAIRSSLREDLYLVLAGVDNTGERASLKLFINPLQVWLWFGILIMMLGSGVVLIPQGRGSKV